MEKYCSVYYDDKWYLGHVISCDDILEFWKVKFLQETHDGFNWPVCDDIQTADKKFILFVPVQLNANLPFHLNLNVQKV